MDCGNNVIQINRSTQLLLFFLCVSAILPVTGYLLINDGTKEEEEEQHRHRWVK